MLAFLNIVALKLHLYRRHLLILTKYAWPLGGGEGVVASLLQKSNFCEPKKRANNFCNLTPFVSFWTNQVSLTIIDVMLIGCQTMINCFVFKRRRHANLLAICGQEFLLFVILVIWKQLIYYFLYKTPNKKHVCMYVCMLCYAMLCRIYPYFKHKLCPHYYASKTLALWPFRVEMYATL